MHQCTVGACGPCLSFKHADVMVAMPTVKVCGHCHVVVAIPTVNVKHMLFTQRCGEWMARVITFDKTTIVTASHRARGTQQVCMFADCL